MCGRNWSETWGPWAAVVGTIVAGLWLGWVDVHDATSPWPMLIAAGWCGAVSLASRRMRWFPPVAFAGTMVILHGWAFLHGLPSQNGQINVWEAASAGIGFAIPCWIGEALGSGARLVAEKLFLPPQLRHSRIRSGPHPWSRALVIWATFAALVSLGMLFGVTEIHIEDNITSLVIYVVPTGFASYHVPRLLWLPPLVFTGTYGIVAFLASRYLHMPHDGLLRPEALLFLLWVPAALGAGARAISDRFSGDGGGSGSAVTTAHPLRQIRIL